MGDVESVLILTGKEDTAGCVKQLILEVVGRIGECEGDSLGCGVGKNANRSRFEILYIIDNVVIALRHKVDGDAEAGIEFLG